MSEVATSHPELAFADLRLPTSSCFRDLARGIELDFTYDGRGALFQLFTRLPTQGRRSILLPAFHCPTVVEPAVQSGFSPRFYRVRKDLTIDTDDFLRCLDAETAYALVVNYFGFPANLESLRTACRDNRTLLIEDCAHSFLNAAPVRLAGGEGDFAVFSFKKLVPSYVGGGIRSNVGDIEFSASRIRPPIYDSLVNVKRMVDQAIDQSDSKVLAGIQKGIDGMYGLLKRQAVETNVETDDTDELAADQYPFVRRLAEARIPWYAKYILRKARLDEVVITRQKNYAALREQLTSVNGIEMMQLGPVDEVCPWALPVVIKDRSTFDRRFRSRGVPLFTFGETLHPNLSTDSAASHGAIDDARYLSSQLLCFSIHQNLSEEVLNSVAGEIGEVLDQP